MRRFLAAIAVCSVLVVTGVPGPATAAAAVTAAGAVTVSGPGGSFVTLAVPQDTVVDFGVKEQAVFDYPVMGKWRTTGFSSVKFTGSGAWSGVLLAADGPTPPAGKICAGIPDAQCPPVAAALQLGNSVVTQGRWASINLGFAEGETTGRLKVPAGIYRLFLIGDDALQQATVKFEGLSGTVSLSATHRAAQYQNRQLAPRLAPATGQKTVQSFGETITTTRHSVVITGLAVAGDVQPVAGTEWGFCGYFGTHPDPAETAFLPGCPSGWVGTVRNPDQGWTLDFSSGDRYTKQTVMWAAGGHGAGKDAAGWWYASYGAPERSESPWLMLDVSAP